MKATVVRQAVRALAHPLAVGAAAVLAANALWWQRAFPSWWTGKIGDVAWLAVAPLGLALVVGVVGEWGLRGIKGIRGIRGMRGWRGWRGLRGLRGDESAWLGMAAILLTGAAFVLVKTVPAANALAREAFALMGVNAKLALDPTDLLALPGLGLAWAAWRSTARERVSGWARGPVRIAGRLLALGLAAGALVADSAAPTPFGVVCVGQGGFTLYAVREWSASGYVNAQVRQEVYTSTDGGATWAFSETAQNDPEEGRGLRHWCGDDEKTAWPLSDPQDSTRQFFFVEGAGIYSTTDGGQTLALEHSAEGLPGGAPSAVFDQETGNLVVAAGMDGVWVRTGEGVWEVVAVGA